jgi:hypothetical protein
MCCTSPSIRTSIQDSRPSRRPNSGPVACGGMDTDQFLQSIELLAGVDLAAARRAAQATLAERIGGRPPPNSPTTSPAS